MTADQPAVRVLLGHLGRTGLGVAATAGELLRAVAGVAPDVVALTGGPAGVRAQPRSAALAADLGLLLLAGGAASGGALLVGCARVQESAVSVFEMSAGGGWTIADLTVAQVRCRFAVLAAPRPSPRQVVVGGERIASARAVVTTKLRASLSATGTGALVPWLLSGPSREIEQFGPNEMRGAAGVAVTTSPGVQVRRISDAALPDSLVLLAVAVVPR